MTKTVLFQTIQFSISTLFNSIRPIDMTSRMLPLWARVDLGVMAIKGHFAFLKTPALLEPHHQIIRLHILETRYGRIYPSAEMQSAYSTVPADRTIYGFPFFERILVCAYTIC